MRRYLIVANQTLGEDELVDVIVRRAKAEPSEFFIVVPATPVMELVYGLEGLPVVMGGSPLIPCTPEHARELAQERLDTALRQLMAAGAKVDGTVGDRDPVRAVEAVMKSRSFDEIIVSTLPKRLSRWLRQDLPTRLEHKTSLPVTHVGAAKQAAH